MGLFVFLEEWKNQKRKQEEERLFQLSFRLPLTALPDELIEFILRYIISNYGLSILQKLLINVPELQKKVLLVSDTDDGKHYLPLLGTEVDVPRIDIKSYELSLVQQHQRKPMIVFFTFYSYHAEHSEMFTTITRFAEDGPYSHLITKKCIILAGKFRYDDLMFHFSERPQKHLKAIATLKGAQFVDNKINDLHSLISLRVTLTIVNPFINYYRTAPREEEMAHRLTNRTFKENISINRQLKFGVIRPRCFNRSSVYIYNIETEMRLATQDRLVHGRNYKLEESQLSSNTRITGSHERELLAKAESC